MALNVPPAAGQVVGAVVTTLGGIGVLSSQLTTLFGDGDAKKIIAGAGIAAFVLGPIAFVLGAGASTKPGPWATPDVPPAAPQPPPAGTASTLKAIAMLAFCLLALVAFKGVIVVA